MRDSKQSTYKMILVKRLFIFVFLFTASNTFGQKPKDFAVVVTKLDTTKFKPQVEATIAITNLTSKDYNIEKKGYYQQLKYRIYISTIEGRKYTAEFPLWQIPAQSTASIVRVINIGEDHFQSAEAIIFKN
jgi:hypothetical protein